MNKSIVYFLFIALFSALIFSACEKEIEAPDAEDEVEEFTYIEFVFTNVEDPEDVRRGIWEDADGFGPQEPVILQHPTLAANTTYKLTYVFENRLLTPVYNLWEEIKQKEDDHQVFYEFDGDMFSSPEGTGNIQDRDGAINYDDFDSNDLPIGLETTWTTAGSKQAAAFRAIQAHQPGVKTATTSWDSGDIDWDITFSINIEE